MKETAAVQRLVVFGGMFGKPELAEQIGALPNILDAGRGSGRFAR